MTCLGITSSTEQGSIALLHKNKIIELASWTQKEQASELMVSQIKNGLRKNKISLDELTLIAVDKGPGSFTGSRIAVNVTKTLAYTLNIPIIALHSLEIMAYEFSRKKKLKKQFEIFTLIDAHKSLFYFQSFKGVSHAIINSEGPIQALSLEDISRSAPKEGSLVLLGPLPKKTLTTLQTKIKLLRQKLKIIVPAPLKEHFPQATSLVRFVKDHPTTPHSSWIDVEPTYIRSPDAVEKLNSLPRP